MCLLSRRRTTFAALFCLNLLVAGPVSAQDSQTSAGCDPRVRVCPEWVPSSVVQGVLRERDDKPFHLALGAYSTAAAADLSISMYRIGQGNAREALFGAPWQNSPVAFGATKGAMFAAVAYGLQRLHVQRPRLAFWLAVATTGVETTITAHNVMTR